MHGRDAMPAMPRARSLGLALDLLTRKRTPSPSTDRFRSWIYAHRETRVARSRYSGSAGRLLLTQEGAPMKITNSVFSALSVTRHTSNLRIPRASLIKSAHFLERI